MTDDNGWHFFADRGGTFTDLLATAPGGRRHVHKLLSHAPGRYEDAVLAGICAVMGIDEAALSQAPVTSLRLGTTVTTNALLEGRTHRCALLTNHGFEDVLRIGDQSRPDLFALRIPSRLQLADRCIGVKARRDAAGDIVHPLEEAEARHALDTLRAAGFDSLAVALLHANVCADDEEQLRAFARDAGFRWICCSHEVSPEPGLLARAQTAVVEAALAPLLAAYVDRLRRALPRSRIRFMQSDGRLADAEHVLARHSIYSGPAGGVTGATRSAHAVGLRDIVGFDMGGTSTDVFCTDGVPPVRDRTEIVGQHIRAPSIDLHTVAAGGGSRLIYEDRRLRVGPESAGADPGPACYGRGGSATVTDANVVLGRVWLQGFEYRFGNDGRQPLDAAASRTALSGLAAQIAAEDAAYAADPDAHLRVARGALDIATTTMAGALRRISIARGIDVRDHALVAFGGAGGQHACAVAEVIGMSRVLVPAAASVLSAAGMEMARLGVDLSRGIDAPLQQEALRRAEKCLAELREEGCRRLREQGEAAEHFEAHLRLHYAGTDTIIEVPPGDIEAVRAAFAAEHERRFGFADPDRPIMLASVHLRVAGASGEVPALATATATRCCGKQAMWLGPDTGWQQVPVYDAVGDTGVEGPALLLLPHSTFVLEAGWRARPCTQGVLADLDRLHDHAPVPGQVVDDPLQRELFNHRFMGIAEEMGESLQRSAQSVNVRNRLDYSCAVFDANGALVANAPHIPVHLGSMGAAVRAVLTEHGQELRAGDGWLINDPYRGGTHLPDLTLIMPVYYGDDATGPPDAFVAARAHHADVGGSEPGSMPAMSRHIDEEGLRIAGERIATAGKLDESLLQRRLAGQPWPARNMAANLADLRAQLAACARGARLLAELAKRTGSGTVEHAMAALLASSERAVRARLSTLQPSSHCVEMDSGARVCVSLSAAGDTLDVDFRDSSGPDSGNENAPEAVVRAAVMYALRCWIHAPVPLNEGFLRAVCIRLRTPSLLSPLYPSAVVAGNVETSQAVTDALLVALGCIAESQGTMNNLSFGNDRFQYYETLCGGAGATAEADGASAVHTHMTNSRITDAEIIERHYPVRVEIFALRNGSGGKGRQRGGDGVIRHLRFLEAARVSLLTNHRLHAPRGIAGGSDAACGRNQLQRADGTAVPLDSRCALDVGPGDVIQIETPGGGGFGRATD